MVLWCFSERVSVYLRGGKAKVLPVPRSSRVTETNTTISQRDDKANKTMYCECVCSYFLRGGSGESLGATPRATDARNSCLFCCTRRAALIILWQGVLRYGRLTFCARSSTTISRSVWEESGDNILTSIGSDTGNYDLKKICKSYLTPTTT